MIGLPKVIRKSNVVVGRNHPADIPLYDHVVVLLDYIPAHVWDDLDETPI